MLHMLIPSLQCITNGLWHHCTQQITLKKKIHTMQISSKRGCVHSWQIMTTSLTTCYEKTLFRAILFLGGGFTGYDSNLSLSLEQHVIRLMTHHDDAMTNDYDTVLSQNIHRTLFIDRLTHSYLRTNTEATYGQFYCSLLTNQIQAHL